MLSQIFNSGSNNSLSKFGAPYVVRANLPDELVLLGAHTIAPSTYVVIHQMSTNSKRL